MQHGQFISHIANVFGESESTIMVSHRKIREAGLTEGTQGRYAPARGARDAANFLCWLGVSDKPTEAPDAIRNFGYCPRYQGMRDESDPLRALNLPDDHTLIEALTALIDATASERLPETFQVEFAPDELCVYIQFFTARHMYTRENDANVEGYRKRYGRPYRVSRVFPMQFVRQLAAGFAAASDGLNEAA